MKKTVAKISHKGTYRIVFDDKAQVNPYTIYHEWYDQGKHSKKIETYADMYSCMYHITHYIIDENFFCKKCDI